MYTNDDTNTISFDNPKPNRRLVLILLALVVALAVSLGIALFSGGSQEPDLADALTGESTYSPPPPLFPSPATKSPASKNDTEQPAPENAGSGGGQQQPSPTPIPGCPTPSDELQVKPDPVTLLGNKGSFVIYNCSAASVQWTAATKPWVTLAAPMGVLGSGQNYRLHFTADTSDLPDGPFSFKIRVSQPGYNEYVLVNGHKLGEAAEGA